MTTREAAKMVEAVEMRESASSLGADCAEKPEQALKAAEAPGVAEVAETAETAAATEAQRDAESVEGDEDVEEQSARDELIELLDARVANYAFLARIFRTEIDEEFLAQIRQMRFPAHTGSADVDEGYRRIVKYLNRPNPNIIGALRVDFVRVFIGGGNDGYSAAYPFESVYTSPRRLTMQNARDEILLIYRSCGLDKSQSWQEGEDHICCELEFMQVMGTRAVDALRKGNEDEAVSALATSRNFLKEHLRAWFPMMAADMHKFAKTDFYQGVANLTIGFLKTDFEFLSDILELNDADSAASTEEELTVIL